MTVPRMVLSHPESAITPSNEYAPHTSSIESATTSRLTREARMPTVPIVIPSETATVFISMGTPPASRMP